MQISSPILLLPNNCKHRNFASTFLHCTYCAYEAAMDGSPGCGCADCRVLRIAIISDDDFLIYTDENQFDWARWRTGTTKDSGTSKKVFLENSSELTAAMQR